MPSQPPGPCLFERKDREFYFLKSVLKVLLLLLCLTACRAGNPPEQSDGSVVKDAIGRDVRVPANPRRIVSLAPSVTEVIYLLGADNRLIGVTTHCDWPEDALRKPKLGTLLTPAYESIVAAEPDLVIASTAGNDRSAVLKLADLGVPVYVTAPRSVQTIFDTVLEIGRITNCSGSAERLVAQMKTRLNSLKSRLAGLPPTRALFVTWFDPLLAPGRGTFENDVLAWANVESVTAGMEGFYPHLSLEQVLKLDPDVILTVRYPGKPYPELSRLAGWRRLSAVRNGRIHVLSEVVQHPSPRFIDGVEELARKLYPERF